MNANTIEFTWECRACGETCGWTYLDLADRGVPVCGKCGEDMELQPESGHAEQEVTELRLCEAHRLFLHPDQLYVFRKDENCQSCIDYAEGRASEAKVVLLTDDGQVGVIEVDMRSDALDTAREALETFHAAYPEVDSDVQVVAVIGSAEPLCEGHVHGVSHMVAKAAYEGA